jgi:hypothetical protein
MAQQPEQQAGPVADLGYLDAAALALRRDELGRLVLSRPDCEDVVGVKVRQGFPLTEPGRFVSLLDEKDNELGIVTDLADLTPEARQLVEEELELDYFMPRVLRIADVKSSHGVTTWDLETDRGEVRIHVRDRADIRYMTPTHVVIVDASAVRYEIPDLTKLDAPSRRRFESQS